MEYLNGQDCSLLLTATGEWGLCGGDLNPNAEVVGDRCKTPARIGTKLPVTSIVSSGKGD